MAELQQLPTETPYEWIARLRTLSTNAKTMLETRALTCALAYARYRLKRENISNWIASSETPHAKA